MKKLLVLVLLSTPQAERAQPEAKPEEIVHQWMTEWTRLDGADVSAARFADLYLPDGVHETGPSARQIGIVRYEGRSDIRTMAKNFGAAHTEITFRIATVTANEKSSDIVHL
ncbi:MAG: hypothetical protein HY646_13285, partial [Acidobacteria bacterium]|nr:hypothetical protein [Acidobacteriota bacterium]